MEFNGETEARMEALNTWYTERTYKYQDMVLPRIVDSSLLPRVKAFKFDQSDILLSTFPRSGTTWVQEMTWLVCNNADTDTAGKVELEDRTHYIEFSLPNITPDIDVLERTPPPRIIKTHFPPQFFESLGQARKCKTIIVMRNLKDILVSHFHFCKDLFEFKGNWDDFFSLFKHDKMVLGSWVTHCLKCWELRDDPNVLILKYEDIKKDPEETIRTIAGFCEKPVSEEQVSCITQYTVIEKMKQRFLASSRHKNLPNKDAQFIRKGVVGDWKEWFTAEQEAYITELLQNTTEKQGLVFTDRLM